MDAEKLLPVATLVLGILLTAWIESRRQNSVASRQQSATLEQRLYEQRMSALDDTRAMILTAIDDAAKQWDPDELPANADVDPLRWPRASIRLLGDVRVAKLYGTILEYGPAKQAQRPPDPQWHTRPARGACGRRTGAATSGRPGAVAARRDLARIGCVGNYQPQEGVDP